MEKVYGPYQYNDRWRVFVAAGPGRASERRAVQFASKEEAEQFVAATKKAAGAKTVETLLEDWFVWLQANKETKHSTIEIYRARLIGGKRVGLLGSVLNQPIKAVNGNKAAQLYKAYQENRAPDTHQGALAECKSFFDWARKQKHIATNPWDDVDPVGKKRRRKEQHRVDSARKLYSYLVQHADQDDGALGALIALLLGFRAGEVVGIRATDLDCDGTVLWAAGSGEGKTSGSTAPVQLPPELQAPLLKRAELRSGRLLPYRAGWVRDCTKRACRAAGVPEICAQALRGMHSTLGLEAGLSAHEVAKTLRHGVQVTRSAYALPRSGQSSVVNRIMQKLAAQPLQAAE